MPAAHQDQSDAAILEAAPAAEVGAPPDDFIETAGRNYKGAPMPVDEDDRCASVCKLGILDTPADPRFDDITKLVRPRGPCHPYSGLTDCMMLTWLPARASRRLPCC